MIQDKTQYFLKIRQTPCPPYSPLTIAPVAGLLDILHSSIQQLESRTESLSTLPNFGSRDKKLREIASIKDNINLLTRDIEDAARLFQCPQASVQDAVQYHIFSRLQLLLTRFRNLEQKQLMHKSGTPLMHKTNTPYLEDTPPETPYIENSTTQEELEVEASHRTNSIKASICNITTSLIQLKMALKAQTGLIDTIDCCFEKSSIYLDKANSEIEKLPGRFGVKDYIIYALLYVICVLIVLIFIKRYKGRIAWDNNSGLVFIKK